MELLAQKLKILIVGGNGFVGSAVCKAALARGMDVVSVSKSGKPYRTPAGHTPAWTSKVTWHAADALHPPSYAHLLRDAGGVVHTLGTLLEDGAYKAALREGNVGGVLGALFTGGGGPLQRGTDGSYEAVNRDSALAVFQTFLAETEAEAPQAHARPFVYLSAEDVFRPLIPARYIETKREAEARIARMVAGREDVRPVFIRPSLIYHAHLRPLVSPVAALLDLSASLHASAPHGVPTPSSLLNTLSSLLPSTSSTVVPGTPLDSLAHALTTPPIHVEHVAEAICIALDPRRVDITGAVGVRRMRELIGWAEQGQGRGEPGKASPRHA